LALVLRVRFVLVGLFFGFIVFHLLFIGLDVLTGLVRKIHHLVRVSSHLQCKIKFR
jgi:hypothetical protein